MLRPCFFLPIFRAGYSSGPFFRAILPGPFSGYFVPTVCPIVWSASAPPLYPPAMPYRDAASDEGVTPSDFLAQSPRARSTCSTMSRTAPAPPLNSET